MIASLMMYQRPQLVGAHNRYWQLIRQNLSQQGIDSPAHLSQDAEEFSVWRNPQLVLSQTCGMPYRNQLHGSVQLVGTPDFGIHGCAAGYYRSALLVRDDDARQQLTEFRDAIFAYNQTYSQSGYAAPYWHIVRHGFWFAKQLHTEQHLESARAVAEGRADIAALDAVTWRLANNYESFAARLKVLAWTEPSPALPLITAMGRDAGAIFEAVALAIEQLCSADKMALGLCGLVKIDAKAYLAVANPPMDE